MAAYAYMVLLLILAIVDVWLVWHCIGLRETCARAEAELATLREKLAGKEREQAELSFRLKWTSAIASASSPLSTAIDGHSDSSDPRCADAPALGLWVQLNRKRASILDSCGLRPEEIREIRLDAPLLASWSESIIGAEDLRLGIPVRLPATVSAGIRRLHVLRFNDESGLTTMLLLSRLPMLTDDPTRDRSLIERLAIEFPLTRQNDIEDQSNDEVRLVRDMLELRSLTDNEFRSPMELLAEFLNKISLTCGYDRGALYLVEREETQERTELLSQGGKAMPRSIYDRWLAAELRFVQQHAARRDIVQLSPDILDSAPEQIPFHSGLILPLLHGSNLFGHLIFTGSQKSQPVGSDLELSRWGAEYLVATIVRTLDRVAVEDQARRDPLTQLANRHAFDVVLRKCVREAALPDSEPCSLILLDLDRFKSINDTFGHLAGDAVLKQAAQVVMSVSNSRVTDRPLVARYGGEEIAVLLPNVAEAGALRIAEAIREAIERTEIPFDGSRIPVTTSAGVAVGAGQGLTCESLIAAADAALYRAKRLGRNRVELAAPAAPACVPG